MQGIGSARNNSRGSRKRRRGEVVLATKKGGTAKVRKLQTQLNNSAIPNHTIERLLGPERWKKVCKYLIKKYDTKKFVVDFTAEGPKIRLHGPTGELLGTVAEVETRANKKGK